MRQQYAKPATAAAQRSAGRAHPGWSSGERQRENLKPPLWSLPKMALSGDFGELASLPQADQDAVGKTLLSLLDGFQSRDANKLTGVYSDSADWVNAFGTQKSGTF